MDHYAQTTYNGRTITIEAGSLNHPGSRNEYKRVVVNGMAQFSFQGDDRFVLAETTRYIDAVDAAAERSRLKAAAGGYVTARNTDFADSWNRAV